MKPAHDKILEWGSIASACAAVVSAVFVGWQAVLFRQALDDPFQANLQNRQIMACEEFFIAHQSWMISTWGPSFSSYTRWTMTNPPTITVGTELADDELAMVFEESNDDLLLRRRGLHDAILRIGIMAGPSGENIADALNALTADYHQRVAARSHWARLREESPMTEDEYEEALEALAEEQERTATQLQEAFSVGTYREESEHLISRCRDVMIGADPGLF